MSQKIFEFEPAIRRLERQAAELMHKDTDLLIVVTEFAFTDTSVSGPVENEWEVQYGYRPMVRAFECKELAGFTTTELSEYLGFNPPNSLLTRLLQTEPHCAWRDRFSDRLKSFITQSAQRILAVAHDMGNPLGMRALEPTDKSDCSNRSQQRYITKKAKNVTDALCQIVFPAIDLDRLDAERSMAILRSSISRATSGYPGQLPTKAAGYSTRKPLAMLVVLSAIRISSIVQYSTSSNSTR